MSSCGEVGKFRDAKQKISRKLKKKKQQSMGVLVHSSRSPPVFSVDSKITAHFVKILLSFNEPFVGSRELCSSITHDVWIFLHLPPFGRWLFFFKRRVVRIKPNVKFILSGNILIIAGIVWFFFPYARFRIQIKQL